MQVAYTIQPGGRAASLEMTMRDFRQICVFLALLGRITTAWLFMFSLLWGFVCKRSGEQTVTALLTK